MADQRPWFKLWYSALSDDSIQNLPPETRWAWVAFGAHTKVHGENGVVRVSTNNAVLAAAMGVTTSELQKCISSFPNCTILCNEDDSVTFTVTWKKWNKYQGDDSRERVARFRARRNAVEEKRSRRELTRKSRETTPTLPSLSSTLDEARDVLAFLNRKATRNYQSEGNLEFIRDRLKAGATVAQCKAVIARKVLAWKGTDMEKFLRPETLFNRTKFAGYVGELPVTAFSPEGGETHA